VLKEAAEKIKETLGTAEISIVLGSGLGGLADQIEDK
jgi:purine nucleoside phosphorylase